MKRAFTLSEVLVTLGIIGVVAAISVPQIVTNYQKHQTIVQLKKVYSDINNAVRLSEAENGPMSDWDFIKSVCYEYECIKPFIERYYLPYFKDAKIITQQDIPDYSDTRYRACNYIRLNNGVLLKMFNHGDYIWLFADINGTKGPNKLGRDIFVFNANGFADFKADGTRVYRITFWSNPYSNATVENLTSPSDYACTSNNTHVHARYYCGKLIEISGWKIPPNYPW